MLKSGHMLSSSTFMDCVWRCLSAGSLDTLSSIIQKCKTSDLNKALSPNWNMCKCNTNADVALQADNSKLAYYALEFLYRWFLNLGPGCCFRLEKGT
ncbi:pentatricopeptide repeat-containing protein At1g26460, mitochondrial-like [Asparagus officinalis]|uniref:pentatricopeptide repeat-containing protein At1g26460, mitochondrial-like n=1 Tax=Asparagus officinalis TaxID=4686 RepID=UPI00098E0E5D|nr:pentatricopeptide repeat-containing protein At1g26460, mitochondrial-like [Asparagus officinalis]